MHAVARRPKSRLRRLLRENGLSLTLVGLFLCFWTGLSIVGHRDYNAEQQEHGRPPASYSAYLQTADFWESTAENWESEFLEMFGYLLLTAFLFQKGSAESKSLDGEEPSDRDPIPRPPRPNAPWPVRQGGFVLRIYQYSLALAFLVCFFASLAIHAVAGAAKYGEEQAAHGEPGGLSPLQYILTAHFWTESLQNWQSEFLGIACVVVFSIFLRQQGSPQSKPVDSPHSQTGGG